MSIRAFVALVLAMLALSATMAAADESVAFAQYWNAEGSFSYASWPNLGDLVPAGRGGDFKTEGFGIEVKADTSLYFMPTLAFRFGQPGALCVSVSRYGVDLTKKLTELGADRLR